MNIVFTYAEENISLQSVSLEICIGKKEIETFSMSPEGQIWQYELTVPPGKHLYRFKINNDLPLCDPYNNLFELDEEKIFWSLLIIDEERSFAGCSYSTSKVQSHRRLGMPSALN